jgi:hypothetical protein
MVLRSAIHPLRSGCYFERTHNECDIHTGKVERQRSNPPFAVSIRRRREIAVLWLSFCALKRCIKSYFYNLIVDLHAEVSRIGG